MNRIDRLTAILLLLQRKKRTAGEIAQRFEVSRRTILRDIDALCEMGIPIAAELGVSGGYSLPSDYSLPALALTLNEALLLRLALSSVSQLSETPFKQERTSLLDKVQTLLPQREQENLDQLAQTLSLNVPSRPYPTPFLDLLLKSAHEQQWISVTYRSENGTSQQTLLPNRIHTGAGLWYCEAYSYERNATRTYRVDRFIDVRRTQAPPQFAEVTPMLHIHHSFPEISISLTARGVLRLDRESYLADYIQQAEDGHSYLKLCLSPYDYDWLVRLLLSLGTDAKVLAPKELYLHMQQAIQDLAQHYTE